MPQIPNNFPDSSLTCFLASLYEIEVPDYFVLLSSLGLVTLVTIGTNKMGTTLKMVAFKDFFEDIYDIFLKVNKIISGNNYL